MRMRCVGRAISVLLACFVAALGTAAARERSDPNAESMRAAARAAGVPEPQLPRATPAELRARRATLAAWEAKVSSEVRDRVADILALAAATSGVPGRAVGRPETLSTEWLQVDRLGRLLLELRVDDVLFEDGALARVGAELQQRARGYGVLTAWVPADAVEPLARRIDVLLVQAVGPTLTNTGTILSEGDGLHRADDARTTFGISGAGEIVGAISNGVESLAASQAFGDLPATVNVPAGCTGSGDEGTAMLEIVHDLAPGAGLAFCGAGSGAAGMINAINTLAAIPGMSAITDDLIMGGESLFEDGPVAEAKRNAVNAGIFYTASAGNRGGQHYEGNFNAPATNVAIGPNTYAAPHDFGGGDNQLRITLATSNSIRLQWAEPYGGGTTDIDLYVVDTAGNVLASSTNVQNGSQDPAEQVNFNATAGTAADIIVDYVGGGAAPTIFFDLRAFGSVGWNEYLVPAGSLDPVARQAEIYVAGAAAAGSPNTVRGFSSRGPARRYFPAPLVTRLKPDGIGIDGVRVTGAGGFGGGTCPITGANDVCTFSGTSASTPHVAGLAVLLLEDQPLLTPAQIADAFNATAVDMDAAGPDNNAGYGLLDVYAAICTFDTDPPDVTCPADATVECSALGGTPRGDAQLASFFDGFTATDECTDPPVEADDAPALFPVATTSVTFTATDAKDNQASCSADVTVEDTTPPTVSAPAPVTLECNAGGGVPKSDPQVVAWLASASASDICEGPLPVTDDAPALFASGCAPGGETSVTFSSTDGSLNTGTASSSVFVQDTTAPVVGCGTGLAELWPPNHEFVDVGLSFSAADVCDTNPLAIAITVTSDEDAAVAAGAGGTNHCPDAQILPDGSVWLRAERSGAGDGRVYVINVRATDSCGNVGLCQVPVRVPYNRTSSGAAVDSGQAYDAATCSGLPKRQKSVAPGTVSGPGPGI